jgi:transcriptional regulator with XRE-family HTH domain
MALGEQLRNARKSKGLTQSEVASGTRMKVQIVNALEEEDFSGIAAPIYGKGFIKLYAEYVDLDPQPLIDEYMDDYVNPAQPPTAEAVDEAMRGASASDVPDMSSETPAETSEETPETYASQDEPDLFSRANTQYTEASSVQHPPPAPGLKRKAADYAGAAKEAWTAMFSKAAPAARKAADATVESFRRMVGFLRSRKWSIPKPSFPQAASKRVAVGIGIVFVVVLVASSLHSCLTRKGKPPPETKAQLRVDLRPATKPPEPFLD